MDQKNNVLNIVIVVMLAAILLGVGILVMQNFVPADEPVARSYQTNFYVTDGGDKAVVASGGELEVQSGGTLDVQSGATFTGDALTAANGITITAGGLQVTAGGINVDGGDVVFDETATVSGTTTMSSALTIAAGGATVTAGGLQVTAGGINVDAGGVVFDETAVISGATTISGTLAGVGAATFSSTGDFAGTLQYGADNLYPLGYASSAQQIVCASTSLFTETTEILVSGVTTVTYVMVSQVTDAASTGAFLTVGTTSPATITIKSWEEDATAGTTGVTAQYCAIGNE